MLYFVDPTLTGVEDPLVEQFTRGVKDSAARALTCAEVFSPTELARQAAEMGSADALLIFNGPNHDGEALAFGLSTAENNGVQIMPVALAAACNEPPRIVNGLQSFRVVDELHRRRLPRELVRVVGAVCGTKILSKVYPTCSQTRLSVFVSYRSKDGSYLSDLACESIRMAGHIPVRDQDDLEPGDLWAESLKGHIYECDAVVFVDTPEAASSEIIPWELAEARRAGMPIIRIRPCGATHEPAVPFREEVDISCDIGKSDFPSWLSAQLTLILADHAQAAVESAFSLLDRIKRGPGGPGRGSIVAEDQGKLIYRLDHSRTLEYGYPTRDRSDCVQLFGRRPTGADIRELKEFRPAGASPEQLSVDASIALCAFAMGGPVVDDHLVVDGSDTKLLIDPAVGGSNDSRRIFISGAIAGEDPVAADEAERAVRAVARYWLERGGRVVYGGHPSFVHLIQAQAGGAPDLLDRIEVFRSTFFEPPEEGAQPRGAAIYVPRGENRPESLSAMRRTMLEGEFDAAVIIGGRSDSAEGESPGTTEEMELALERGIPVFCFGATGGNAAHIVAEVRESAQPYEGLRNGMSFAENDLFATSLDFVTLAEMIWRRSSDEGL